MPLLFLPLEVLQHIAACVEAAHQPSVQAFSLTSQACHEASLCIIFQRTSITVRDREGLRRDVDALIEALESTNSFRYIQQITIKGALRLKSKKNEGYATRTPWLAYTGLSEILDEEPISYNGMYAVYDEASLKGLQKRTRHGLLWSICSKPSSH